MSCIMSDKLEELKLAYEKAEKECEDARKEYNSKMSVKTMRKAEYEKELYKDQNCDTCKYSIVHDFIGDNHNACGCENAPCTCCHCWCENYQPDTPLTKAVKDNLDCFIDFTAYKGLKKFYGDILTTEGSIDPKDKKEYNPTAKTLYNILKARYGEKAK